MQPPPSALWERSHDTYRMERTCRTVPEGEGGYRERGMKVIYWIVLIAGLAFGAYFVSQKPTCADGKRAAIAQTLPVPSWICVTPEWRGG